MKLLSTRPARESATLTEVMLENSDNHDTAEDVGDREDDCKVSQPPAMVDGRIGQFYSRRRMDTITDKVSHRLHSHTIIF